LKIPGEIFKKHINAGEPDISGWYLCYVRPKKKSAISVIPMTDMKVLLFENEKWWCSSDHVIGWMGPLPVFSLDEIQGELGEDSTAEVYAIGTLDEGTKGQFTQGPFYESCKIMFQEGFDGDYAFIVNSRKTEAVPFKRWNSTKNLWEEFKVKPKSKGLLAQKKKTAKTNKELASLPYYIGTKKQAAYNNWLGGPFWDITEAMKAGIGQFKGGIIWMLFEGDNPFPEREWKDDKWDFIDITKVRKLEKVVQILRRKNETKKD